MEKKNRLTLIVDGNWLYMTQIFMCGSALQSDTDASYELLKKSFLTAIESTVEQLACCDNWIVVTDNGSWRKSLERPARVEAAYKGQRVPDEKYNWERIWETYEEIKEILRNGGVTLSCAEEIEGDDWCAYWAGALAREGISAIIWSRDHDLQQLVTWDNTRWTGWWNSKDGLVLHKNGEPACEFFRPATPSDMLLDSVRQYASPLRYIDPVKEIIVEKVWNGDVSDNIKPVIYRAKNDRVFRLTKKELPYGIDIDDSLAVRGFVAEKLSEEKYSGLSEDEVLEHFEYNKRLVLLQSRFYPDYVKRRMASEAPEYKIAGRVPAPAPLQIQSIIDLL